MRLRSVWDSYVGRLVSGVVGLFVILPLITYALGGDYTLGVYIGTGVAVLWYTVETYYLRRAAVMPIVVARVQMRHEGELAGIGPTYTQKVVLQNVGKSAALFVEV